MNSSLNVANPYTLLLGVVLLAIAVAVIRSDTNVVAKVIAVVVAFAGVAFAYQSFPHGGLRWGLVLALVAIALGILLFPGSNVIGAILVIVGILAFLGGGYWYAPLPLFDVSLHHIWSTGVNGVRQLFDQGNAGH